MTEQRWNAADYAHNSTAQWQWAQELVAKLGLQGHERLVDIGCGDGKITASIARQLPRGAVLGIDASSQMIALASTSYPPTQYPNLEFRQMDATALDLPSDLDVAFSNATLHWIQDHRAVLRGVRTALRREGRLLFQMGGRGNADDVLAVVQGLTRAPAWSAYFVGFRSPYHFYGVEEYRAWLPALGFDIVRLELIPKDMRHNNPDGLKGWLRTTWFPYTDCLPVERREPFLDALVAAYLAEHPVDQEGGTHVRMVRLEVEAAAC